jgi:hypothetical protein
MVVAAALGFGALGFEGRQQLLFFLEQMARRKDFVGQPFVIKPQQNLPLGHLLIAVYKNFLDAPFDWGKQLAAADGQQLA